MASIAAQWDCPAFTMPFNVSAMVLLGATASVATAQSLPGLPADTRAAPEPLLFPAPGALLPRAVLPALSDPTPASRPAFGQAACFLPSRVTVLRNGTESIIPVRDLIAVPPAGECAGAVAAAVLRGVAQVYFCDSAAAGIAVVVGFALGSPLLAAASVVGSGAGLATGVIFRAAPLALERGLYGYNAVIAIMASCVFTRPHPHVGTACVAVGCAVFATLLYAWLGPVWGSMGVPVATLPFCLAGFTWLIAMGAGVRGRGGGVLGGRRIALADAAMP